MASRHSAFYSPLLCSVAELQKDGHDVSYSVLQRRQTGHGVIRDGAVDILQSAVSSYWQARERGVSPLPVHFAQINRRDGFFLVGRQPDSAFEWERLPGCTVLADHGAQPLVMLQYAVRFNSVDWDAVRALNAGTPEEMAATFAAGVGDYIHLQAPILAGEIVSSVGASMPPVAFSSLCCAREFQKTEEYRTFLAAYEKVRPWVHTADPKEVAEAEGAFFPAIPRDRLVDAVRRYQALGCWEGGIEIPRDLYEQALDVFQCARAINDRHPYEDVCRR